MVRIIFESSRLVITWVKYVFIERNCACVGLLCVQDRDNRTPLECFDVVADALLISGGLAVKGVGTGVADSEAGAELECDASAVTLGRQSSLDRVIDIVGLASL